MNMSSSPFDFIKYTLYPRLAYPERLLTQGYPFASDCLKGWDYKHKFNRAWW